ncbi:MAG: type II toxin-antitoxin system prevent-host-death family antitoxin [Thermoflexaceae bacterium]|nr:type II toxin-antitoxin system prevent-host-death family antitoxin [Thermoflexaceae bacterium]
MGELRVSTGIVPLGDFKAHASRLLREIGESGGPIVITQNGRPAAVVLSPQAYDEMHDRVFLAAVEAGIVQADAGLLVDHERVQAWVESWGANNEEPMPLPG